MCTLCYKLKCVTATQFMTSQGHDESGALRAGARQRAAVAQAQEQSRRPGEQRHLTAETNATTGRSAATVAARLPRIQTGRRHSLLSVFQRTSISLVSNPESIIVLYILRFSDLRA